MDLFACPCCGLDASCQEHKMLIKSLMLDQFSDLIVTQGTRCFKRAAQLRANGINASFNSAHAPKWSFFPSSQDDDLHSVGYDLTLKRWTLDRQKELFQACAALGCHGLGFYDDGHVHADWKPRIQCWSVWHGKYYYWLSQSPPEVS